jgi:hypothetical protein
MTPHPPDYAVALIEALVPRARRDSIVGDLLEEYHESVVPRQGSRAADGWFLRQALAFLWSASAAAGLAIAAIFTIRMLIGVAQPSNDLALRAQATTFVTMGLFVASGFRLGRSTGRFGGAAIVAIAATVIGTIYAYAMVFLCMAIAAVVVHPSPAAWIGLREGLDIPVHVIAVIGVLLASAGSAVGRLFIDPQSRGSLRT